MSQYRINNCYFNDALKIGDFNLIQAGSLYCDAGEEKPEHFHINWYEYTIVKDGIGYVSTNGIETKVKKDDIYFSYPLDNHSIRSSKDHPLHYDFLSFYVTDSAYTYELEKIMENFSPDERVIRETHIPSLFSDFLIEIENDTNNAKYSKDLLELQLRQIFIYTVRTFNIERQLINQKRKMLSRSELLCHKAMNYIDRHILTIDDLSEISKETKYSYNYLSTLFKQTTGQTLNNYYQSKKMEIAKQLLLEGKLKITQISEMLNYSSLFSFSRAFKNQFGFSPKELVSNNKKHNSPDVSPSQSKNILI